MTESQLQAWLAKSSCEQYLPQFLAADITFDLLPELDLEALRELGVTKLGDRLRLELAVGDLRLELLKQKVPLEDIRRAWEARLSQDTQPDATSHDNESGGESGELTIVPREPMRVVTFILPDGLLKKVNVDGCFNAQLVKRKVLKKLGVRGRDNEYDTHVHTAVHGDMQVRRLNDVEFVTICFAPKRQEKHRIMLTAKNEQVSAAAAEQLLRIVQRMAGRKPAPQGLRDFFGQRPPSELISLNLGQYFPTAPPHDLEATIRNLVRHSMRLLRRFVSLALLLAPVPLGALGALAWTAAASGVSGFAAPSFGAGAPPAFDRRTVGDFFVHNLNLVDEAKHDAGSTDDVASGALRKVATLFASPASNRYLRIELMSVDSDDEDDEDERARDFGAGRKWVQGARIGAGLFGTVYLGMDPATGELMAVKQVPIPRGASRQNEQHRGMIDALHREMLLLKELSHENIVRYYGLSCEGDFLNIFLEYIPGGLVQLMLQLYGPFEEPLIRSFIRQVLVGLSYLHGMDIIHRDIKGANILIDIKGAAKISDFGISKKVDGDEEATKSARRASLQGSVYWMAPEVVKQTVYTKKADIWSVGCLVVEMFTGNHPFPKFSQMQAIFKIGTHTSPEIPEWCTAEGKDFLTQTFEVDHERRPCAAELLAEPFVTPLVVTNEEFLL